MEYIELSRRLCQEEELYIYGAGVVAYGACKAVQELFSVNCKCYLVTERQDNPDEIGGIPVKEIGEIAEKQTYILIATPEQYHQEIVELLRRLGHKNFDVLDSHLEYCLMGEYLAKIVGCKRLEDFGSVSTKVYDVCVGMAVSHGDRQLQSQYQEPFWVQKIQVGAALADRKIAEIQDHIGDNISLRNALYGELTASYWMWKNAPHEVMGLFHYRRILRASEEVLSLLQQGDIDVILPLPFVCYPDASGQYGRYLTKEDQMILWDVLAEFDSAVCERAERVLREPYLYNYNMLIARREVYEDYCGWMFPLLFEMEKRCVKLNIERLPRYIGRMGEVLTSIYFLLNEKKWKIVHGEKCWRI